MLRCGRAFNPGVIFRGYANLEKGGFRHAGPLGDVARCHTDNSVQRPLPPSHNVLHYGVGLGESDSWRSVQCVG